MRNSRPTYGRSRSNLSSHDASHAFDAIKSSANQVPSAEDMHQFPAPEEILQFKYEKHCYSVAGFTPPVVHGQWTARKCNGLTRYWNVNVRSLSKVCTTYRNMGQTIFVDDRRAQKERDIRSTDLPDWSFQNADESFPFWNDIDIDISPFTRPPLIDTEWYGLKPLQHEMAPYDIPIRSRFDNYLRHPLLRFNALLSSCKDVESRAALERVFSTFTMALLCRPVDESEEKRIEALTKTPKQNCRVKSLRSLASYASGKAYVMWKDYDATEDEEDSWYEVVGDLGRKGELLPEMIRGHVCQAVIDGIQAGWFPTEFAQILILQSLALQRQSLAADLYHAILENTRYTYHPRASRDIAPSPFCSITFSPCHLFSSMLDKLYDTPQILLEGWLSQVLMEGLKEIHLHPNIDLLAMRFMGLALGIETWQTELHKRRCLSQKLRERQNRRRSKTIVLPLDQPPWLCTVDTYHQNDVCETTLKITKHLIRLGWNTLEYDTERANRSRDLVYRIAEYIRQWSFLFKPSARDESLGKLRKVKVLMLIFSLHGLEYSDMETRESTIREIVRLLLGATIRYAESEEDETLRPSEVDIKDIADDLAKYLHKMCSLSESETVLLLFDQHARFLLEILMDSARGINNISQDTSKLSLATKTPLRGNNIYEKRKKFLLAMLVNHASNELYRLRNTMEWNEFASTIERRVAELKVPHQNTITADDLKTPRFSMLIADEEEKKEVTWRYEEMLGAWVAITPKDDKPKCDKQSRPVLERFHSKATMNENIPFSLSSKKCRKQIGSSTCSSRSDKSDTNSDSDAASETESQSSFNDVMSCNTTRPTSIASSISPRSPPSRNANTSLNSDILTPSIKRKRPIIRSILKRNSNHFSPLIEAQSTRKRLRSDKPRRFFLDHVLIMVPAQSQNSIMRDSDQFNKTKSIVHQCDGVDKAIPNLVKRDTQTKSASKTVLAKRRRNEELAVTDGMAPQEKLDYLGKKYPSRWCARRSGPPPTEKDRSIGAENTLSTTHSEDKTNSSKLGSHSQDDQIDLPELRPTHSTESKLVLEQISISKQKFRPQNPIDLDDDCQKEKSDDLHDELELEMHKDETLEKGAITKRRRVSLAPPAVVPKSNATSNTTITSSESRKRGRPRLDKPTDINTPKKPQQCAPSSSPFGFGLTPATNRTSSNVNFHPSRRKSETKLAKTFGGGTRGRASQGSGKLRGRPRSNAIISSGVFP